VLVFGLHPARVVRAGKPISVLTRVEIYPRASSECAVPGNSALTIRGLLGWVYKLR
jgi:hypothetical protein